VSKCEKIRVDKEFMELCRSLKARGIIFMQKEISYPELTKKIAKFLKKNRNWENEILEE
jgi:hypothetical protein